MKTVRSESIFIRLDRALRALRGNLDSSDFQTAVASQSWRPRLVHPGTESRYKAIPLRAGGRDLAATDPYARQFLRLLDLFVAGPTGFTVRAEVKRPAADGAGLEFDTDTNVVIDASWKDWAENPVTTDRRSTFPGFCHLYQRTIATDGEVFVRMFDGYPNRHGFALQFIDPDQIDVTVNQDGGPGRNEIRQGIEIDEYGAEVGFWVNDFPAGGSLYGYGQRRRAPYYVPAYNPFTDTGEMLHDFLPLRGNQPRGLTWFAPVLDASETRLNYADAELTAAYRASAMPTVLTARAETAADLMNEEAAPVDANGNPTPKQRPTLEVDPRVIPAIAPGWTVETADANHPTTAYSAFMKDVLRAFSSGLGPTYETLCNDRESTNYGSLRGGLQLERDFWRYLQHHMIGALLRPVRRRFLRASILWGAMNDGEGLVLPSADYRRYVETAYDPRGFPWIDPLKDIQYAALALQLGLTTRTELAAEMGKRWADMARKLADEKTLAELLDISVDPPGSAQASAAQTTAAEDAAAAAKNGAA